MKNTLAIILLAITALGIYAFAAYTRPHEPAGRALHNWLATTQRDQAAEMAMEIASMRSAGYTLAECCSVYNATTDAECERIERLYNTATPQLETVPATATPYTPAELDEIYPSH